MLDTSKRSVLRGELERLLLTARANDTVLDLSVRRSPGPVSNSDWVEFVGTLTDKPDDRTYSVVSPSSRLLGMTRKGRV